MLDIQNLSARAGETEIIRGLDLRIMPGEIHAILGPNGSGKSTLSRILMGDPRYEVTGGQVLFRDQDVLAMEPEERSRVGLFLGFQSPVEIPGVTLRALLGAALGARAEALGDKPLTSLQLRTKLKKCALEVGLDPSFLDRGVGENCSGGEKKRLEIFQMRVLEPQLAVLDELDSGLDIDALRNLSALVRSYAEEKPAERALLLITHYRRLLEGIPPTHVHIFHEGRIIRSGGEELVSELERGGYENLIDQ